MPQKTKAALTDEKSRMKPAALASHARLFGPRAKASPGYGGPKADALGTPDEQAFVRRPRSANYKKDIHLPRESRKVSR